MGSVLFIRHAQSEANAGLRTADAATISVTDRGREQAKCVAAAVSNAPSLVVTSSFLRTKQTAQPLLERFAAAPSEEWNIHEFMYLNPQAFEGRTCKEREPLVEAYWRRCDAYYRDGPGAESFADFMTRIRELDRKLCQLDEHSTVIFTHGFVIRAVLWLQSRPSNRLGRHEIKSFEHFCRTVIVPNCSILLGEPDPQLGVRIRRKISFCHLAPHLRTE